MYAWNLNVTELLKLHKPFKMNWSQAFIFVHLQDLMIHYSPEDLTHK